MAKLKTPRWAWALTGSDARCVLGISDTLVPNVFAQAGKCQIPAIVFACDTTPERETEAPRGMVKVYPRDIDLKNTKRLKSFASAFLVESLEQFRLALGRRRHELHG
jgi:dihydromethanopterin reductase (acceptor)